jgi:hypothetical protein
MIKPLQNGLIPTTRARNPGYKKLMILNEPPPNKSADANANFLPALTFFFIVVPHNLIQYITLRENDIF